MASETGLTAKPARVPARESSRYLAVAVQAARASGRLLMRRMGTLRTWEVRRKGKADWVTDVDRESERTILALLRKHFPGHAVQAEESSPGRTSGSRQWLIDPLDGTVNYMHRFPIFCVSIALAVEGQVEVGVVLDPVRQELFTARRGHGARLNGRRIRVSAFGCLKDALVCTGFPFRMRESLEPYLRSFQKILLAPAWVRRPGSAALDLAYTACGRSDGFWETGLNPWDVAAGSLLVEEAGGRVTDFRGGDSYLWTRNIAAGNPAVHRDLLKVVRPIFRGRFG